MTERRAAGFNIPLNFYDGSEVESIPRRIRAAAVGVWALAGDYAATHLTDGHVPAGILKSFGCTTAIRAALKVTTNKTGELSPLWIDAKSGGIQLTNWPKHQRTNAEVTSYREAEAERKRREREAKNAAREAKLARNFDGTNAYLIDNFGEVKSNEDANSCVDNTTDNATTSANGETSGRTTGGRSTAVRPDVRDPKTETETETKSLSVETSKGGVTSSDAHDPRPQCPDHEENSGTNCRACGRRRKWDEAHEAQSKADDLDERRRAREVRDNCPTCHGTCWIPGTDPAVKCNHQEVAHA